MIQPNTTKNIAAFDPSSKITGACVLIPEGSNLPRLVSAWRIKPDKATAPAIDRIDNMVEGVREILRTHKPSLIIVEITTGKVAGRFKGQKISGQGVYGMAVGAVQQTCMNWAAMNHGVEVIRVRENVWTNGKAKNTRAQGVHALYPSLDWSSDTGHDIADSIGLALWGIGERNL